MVSTTRGFTGRPRRAADDRLPPGQYDVGDAFPVLSAGPTPSTDLATWDLTVQGQVDRVARWTWQELAALPHEDITVDLHCVTAWSKFDTRWRGVPVDVLLEGLEVRGAHVTAFSDGGYTTNVPLADLRDGRAWVVDGYGGAPLDPVHGGPVRLLVPHLYLWKSAKWLRGLAVTEQAELGFWERFGYHAYGDPWREQRYARE